MKKLHNTQACLLKTSPNGQKEFFTRFCTPRRRFTLLSETPLVWDCKFNLQPSTLLWLCAYHYTYYSIPGYNTSRDVLIHCCISIQRSSSGLLTTDVQIDPKERFEQVITGWAILSPENPSDRAVVVEPLDGGVGENFVKFAFIGSGSFWSH